MWAKTETDRNESHFKKKYKGVNANIAEWFAKNTESVIMTITFDLKIEFQIALTSKNLK